MQLMKNKRKKHKCTSSRA